MFQTLPGFSTVRPMTSWALSQTPGIKFIHFDERDVVRHRLVQAVITAYESFSGESTIPDPIARAKSAD